MQKLFRKKKRKIGYALGGGVARGLSHIGVLKVLEENNVFPDVIAGTSIGALIGALYASGLKATEIEQLARQLDWKQMTLLPDFTLSRSGLIEGKRVTQLLRSVLGETTFSHLKYPFACVATDISSGQQVVLSRGSLVEAIRASISIPGIFTPVRIGKVYLVDGGLVNEVPVSICRKMGADYVIGVNVIPDPAKTVLGSEKEQAENTLPSGITSQALEDERERHPLRNGLNHSLRSRLEEMESAIRMFLLHHSKEQGSATRPAFLTEADKPSLFTPKAPNIIDVLSQTLTIAEYRVALENLKEADLAISPDVGRIGFWQFDRAAVAIHAGEEAARRALKGARLAKGRRLLS